MSATSTSEIKVVGKSGQISLGKRYAGKTLELQRLDDGSLLLRAVAMVPESSRSPIDRGSRGGSPGPRKRNPGRRTRNRC